MIDRKAKRVFKAIIRPDGRVSFPPDMGDFKLGQRVFFWVEGQACHITPKPKRSFNGRMLSSRIRRGVLSLAKYGPRNCP